MIYRISCDTIVYLPAVQKNISVFLPRTLQLLSSECIQTLVIIMHGIICRPLPISPSRLISFVLYEPQIIIHFFIATPPRFFHRVLGIPRAYPRTPGKHSMPFLSPSSDASGEFLLLLCSPLTIWAAAVLVRAQELAWRFAGLGRFGSNRYSRFYSISFHFIFFSFLLLYSRAAKGRDTPGGQVSRTLAEPPFPCGGIPGKRSQARQEQTELLDRRYQAIQRDGGL